MFPHTNTLEADERRLQQLTEREAELRLQIDALQKDIARLEVSLAGDASSTSGQDTGSHHESSKSAADATGGAELDLEEFRAPEWCVPIKANVMTFEWTVAIAYQQLPDVCIESLPIEKLQTNGLIFIWVINAKYVRAFELMERWGYEYVDEIAWVKQTGNDPPGYRPSSCSDVIYSERRGQSQKPEELYEMIEHMVPNGKYLEIFGRKNNLRDYWITIGNEL
ncbi:hypothetical protein SYNPS1DRAFT_25890 [Syncephalis pseudoplumigaleata]|uniref:mRNA m(6)A methyltransferase n=1 Tax=Syncephalis pseudoplumigaleata TaxID=1712513 RepID=A0A4P9YU67_9FUNG|nr:hypothetical protein SYNPS1DRAFT_25890 [Syncephalis pseudoplumigaleata]|eukprot:RKP22390.1 hypothetical protein SYNPS1DRAFT_25890 [Syncephalis pseudoplumigaleata]